MNTWRQNTSLLLIAALVASASCNGCDEEELDRLRPALSFEPQVLDFGPRALGQGHVLRATASSTGSLDLHIIETRLEPAEAPFVLSGYPEFLSIGAQEEISVTFTPQEHGEVNAELVFVINAETDNEVRLPLRGSVAPPRIEIAPTSVDFGPVNQDTGATQAIQVSNVGGDWLDVSAVTLLGPGPGFTLSNASETTLHDLGPGEYRLLHLRFVPEQSGPVTNTVRFTSNAENGPETEVALQAVGNLSPVVTAYDLTSGRSELSVDPDMLLTLSSEGSYDPEGQNLNLYWQIIERPPGSTATLPSAERETVQTHIEPGLVGDYVVRVLATDPLGAQGASDVVIHAIRDLVITLRWQTAHVATCQAYSEEACAAMTPSERQSTCCGQTDIDLHLVAPGGTVGDYLGSCPSEPGCSDATCGCVDQNIAQCVSCVSKGTDCAYANRHPDWGTVGDALDDPSLDLDDVRGSGPEVISLNGPVDGTYGVYAHFCNDRITEPTDAFVDIYIKGELRWSLGPQRLEGQGKIWTVALITKAGEIWTKSPLTGQLDNADTNLCAR